MEKMKEGKHNRGIKLSENLRVLVFRSWKTSRYLETTKMIL
jgi:hypothetical protein